MGFAYDTAVTTNQHFVDYGFEQEIANVERDTSALANLQKGAVNVAIRSLKSKGVDHTKVSNTEDFELELIYWCLMTLYAGETAEAIPGSPNKHEHYMKLWEKAVTERIIKLDDGTYLLPGGTQGLPKVANHDSNAFFPTSDTGTGRPGQSKISNFDDFIWHRPV